MAEQKEKLSFAHAVNALSELVKKKLRDPQATEHLVNYLSNEYSWFKGDWAEKFTENKIDAHTFALVSNEMLTKMRPDSKISERLLLTRALEKIQHAKRVNARNQIVHEGEAVAVSTLSTDRPVLFKLTHAELTFNFTQIKTIKEDEYTTRTVTTELVDTVDFSIVEDCDRHEEHVTTTKRGGCCFCCAATCWCPCNLVSEKPGETKSMNRVYITLTVPKLADQEDDEFDKEREKKGLGLTNVEKFMDEMVSYQANSFTVDFKTEEEAIKFQDTLLDMVNEVQFMEGRAEDTTQI